MDSSLSSSSSLHLAMAALVGASLMAISAFYFHKRSVDQVLDRLIEIRCKPRKNTDNNNQYEAETEESDGEFTMIDSEAPLDEKTMIIPRCYRISSSLPNVVLGNDWFEDDEKFDDEAVRVRARAQVCSASSLDKLNIIPSGLPPLQLAQRNGHDHSVKHPGSGKRVSSFARLITPRSPGLNAFDSVGDSDEEEPELANEDDILFSYGEIDSSADFVNENACVIYIFTAYFYRITFSTRSRSIKLRMQLQIYGQVVTTL